MKLRACLAEYNISGLSTNVNFLMDLANNPRTIIQPGVQPGECWAFKGSSGFVVIQLSEPIVPTRFSMEHISKSMSPSGKIDSAPKDFVVYGLRHEKDTDPVILGEYSYSQD